MVWSSAVDKSRGSKSVEVRRVWDIYDERLQFMSRRDVLLLDDSLGAGDVSRAWLVWSGAVESALADAYRSSGGPLPSRGLVLGRVVVLLLGVVRLGGHKVRKARGNAADAHDAADVFLYRDSSIAPLLDMRRRFKAVMDVLDSMIRNGVSLSRSVELSAQWDRILDIGPLYPVTLDDLNVVCTLWALFSFFSYFFLPFLLSFFLAFDFVIFSHFLFISSFFDFFNVWSILFSCISFKYFFIAGVSIRI